MNSTLRKNPNFFYNWPITIAVYVGTFVISAFAGHFLSRLLNRWF